jgi:hypothetical protein
MPPSRQPTFCVAVDLLMEGVEVVVMAFVARGRGSMRAS